MSSVEGGEPCPRCPNGTLKLTPRESWSVCDRCGAVLTDRRLDPPFIV